ncbi:hypothetical protein ACTD5D_21365 [Nocardia takedensis]|uniref:hypothetical protein n=1 Tax=Nocardia takedensis TaxID=259390 RepID=UPI003F767C41
MPRGERDVAVAQVRADRDAVQTRCQHEQEVAAAEVANLRWQLQEVSTARTAAETALAALRERHDEELALVRDVHTDLTEVSAPLTTQALHSAGDDLVKRFTDLADQRAQATARELDEREDSIVQVLKPVAEAMDKASSQMSELG